MASLQESKYESDSQENLVKYNVVPIKYLTRGNKFYYKFKNT